MPRQSQETTNARTSDAIENTNKKLNDLAKTVKDNDEHYYVVFVKIEDWLIVRNVVYGLIGIILLAVANQIVNGALKH